LRRAVQTERSGLARAHRLCNFPWNQEPEKAEVVRAGIFIIVGFVVAGVASVAARAEGDAARGKAVFVQCMACHSLAPNHNGIGPSLHGLFGRKAGTLPDFAYSPSMKRSGITWSVAALRSYLPDPQAKVPGTKMTFLGISDPQQLDDLIAYLQQATK
jgi:cytochrome c